MKGGQDEDGGFSETRLCLAKNIDIQNGGRNANLLDYSEAERYVRLVFDPLRLFEKRKQSASQSPSIPESSNKAGK
jgi:hypothetical protein